MKLFPKLFLKDVTCPWIGSQLFKIPLPKCYSDLLLWFFQKVMRIEYGSSELVVTHTTCFTAYYFFATFSKCILLAYFLSHILQPSVCICWLLSKIKEALKIDGIVFQLDEITIKKLLHKASLYKVHLFLYLHFLAKWRSVARQKKGGLGGGGTPSFIKRSLLLVSVPGKNYIPHCNFTSILTLLLTNLINFVRSVKYAKL